MSHDSFCIDSSGSADNLEQPGLDFWKDTLLLSFSNSNVFGSLSTEVSSSSISLERRLTH